MIDITMNQIAKDRIKLVAQTADGDTWLGGKAGFDPGGPAVYFYTTTTENPADEMTQIVICAGWEGVTARIEES